MKDGHTTCLYTDASQSYWAAVFTQVPDGQLGLIVYTQEHTVLELLSGKFYGHAEKWSTVEKEAFAVVEAMSKMEHISSAQEVHILTDHAILIYIFDPFGNIPAVSRHVAHKLMRWEIKLSADRYVIDHISVEKDVWDDRMSLLAVLPRVTTYGARLDARVYASVGGENCEKDWPSKADIKKHKGERVYQTGSQTEMVCSVT